MTLQLDRARRLEAAEAEPRATEGSPSPPTPLPQGERGERKATRLPQTTRGE
jgi:hypothetical protein